MHIIWATSSENVPSDMCSQWKLRSDCAFAQSDHNIHLGALRMANAKLIHMSSLCAHVRRYVFSRCCLFRATSSFQSAVKTSWGFRQSYTSALVGLYIRTPNLIFNIWNFRLDILRFDEEYDNTSWKISSKICGLKSCFRCVNQLE